MGAFEQFGNGEKRAASDSGNPSRKARRSSVQARAARAFRPEQANATCGGSAWESNPPIPAEPRFKTDLKSAEATRLLALPEP